MINELETAELVFAVSYLRVSTKEPAECDGSPKGYSILGQREVSQRKAASVGAVITTEFLDYEASARLAARPALQRMLTYLAEHSEIAYVIVDKLDRLARNQADHVDINLALKQAGVTLVSASDPIDETPSGSLLHNVMTTVRQGL